MILPVCTKNVETDKKDQKSNKGRDFRIPFFVLLQESGGLPIQDRMIFMKRNTISLLIVVGVLFSTGGYAQSLNRKMTLTDVIYTAHEQSPSALVAKHNFLGNYWAYPFL